MRSACRLLAAFLAVSTVFPCSIDTSPLFVPVHRPEKFDTAFLRGQLGIIPSTLSGRYKIIAWRYLAGLPLTHDEQEAILARQNQVDPASSPAEQWQTARNTVNGTNIVFISTGKASRLDQGAYYENCLDDAFVAAVRTLNDRRKAYSNSDTLKSWLAAQDAVFRNCTSTEPVYPPDPEAGMKPLARADRMYQIAAACFYAEDFEDAAQRFRDIAADNSSPWRDTASYMVARTLVREISLSHRPEAAAEAKAQLQKIAPGPLHDSAQGLIEYVDSLADPASVLKMAAGKLVRPNPGPSIADAYAEGTYILRSDRFRSVLTRPDLPAPFDWIAALESDMTGYSLQRWRESHSTLWLTAALVRAAAGQEGNPELIEAAGNVPRTSPAFDTVTFNSLRLLIANGQTAKARRRLDDLLAGKRRNLDSVDNAYREQRAMLSISFDDFLHWAPRRAIGIGDETYDYGGPPVSPNVGYDSVAVLNTLAPLARLAEAAESARLPEEPRTDIAISAFTRAFILGDEPAADRLVPILVKAHRSWATDLDDFRRATGDTKRFAGALLIARHSEFHPRVWLAFAPQWWCDAPPPGQSYPNLPDAALSPDDRTQAAEEIGRVQEAGPAQSFLAPIVMS